MPLVHIRNLWFSVKGYLKKPQRYIPCGKSLAQCHECFELVMANAGVGLVDHLSKVHGLSKTHSNDTLAWVSIKVYRKKLEKKG